MSRVSRFYDPSWCPAAGAAAPPEHLTATPHTRPSHQPLTLTRPSQPLDTLVSCVLCVQRTTEERNLGGFMCAQKLYMHTMSRVLSFQCDCMCADV